MVFSGFKKIHLFLRLIGSFTTFLQKKIICASVIAATSPLTLGEKSADLLLVKTH